MIQLYHQMRYKKNSRTYKKIIVNEKIKTIENNRKQNRPEYNLDRKTAKISTLSRSLGKWEVLTCKDLLPEKRLLSKVARIKTFEYFPLGKELKKHLTLWENNIKD